MSASRELQSRLVIATQATVHAVIGLAFGVLLGVAVGRMLWRGAAGMTPLAYHPALAVWALARAAPLALLAANLLAAWPGERAAGWRSTSRSDDRLNRHVRLPSRDVVAPATPWPGG